jgi:hypothetical protein
MAKQGVGGQVPGTSTADNEGQWYIKIQVTSRSGGTCLYFLALGRWKQKGHKFERPAWLHSKFRASLFYLSSKRKKQKERVERGRERERQREKHVGYLKKFFFIVLGGGTL